MRVDGKQIQDDLKADLKKRIAETTKTFRLAVIYAGDNDVIDRYIEVKKDFGEDIGVPVAVHRFSGDITQNKLQEEIESVLTRKTDGVVIQLPLPRQIDEQMMLNLIPVRLDVDVLSKAAYQAFARGDLAVMPPVVAAVAEIFNRHNVSLTGKNVLVIGRGRLVGLPTIAWLLRSGITPDIVDRRTEDIDDRIRAADVIISGAGSPHLVTPDLISDGVVLVDAGSSESEGVIKGDIDPVCAEKASLLAPVPGGVGPITVAKLFENLVTLNTSLPNQ